MLCQTPCQWRAWDFAGQGKSSKAKLVLRFVQGVKNQFIVQKVACLPKSWPIVPSAHAPEGPEAGEPGKALRGGHGAGVLSGM